jgi:hypothetical protein
MFGLLRRLIHWKREVEEPFDWAYPDSHPPTPEDLDCPDTQPTSPGALDSDLQRLE